MITLNKTEKKVGKTGYKGVHMVSKNCFQSTIGLKIAGKQQTKIIGSFKTPEEAYVARVTYIKKLL